MPETLTTSKRFFGKDIKQKKFGRLTAISFLKYVKLESPKKHQLWSFRCDCGNVISATRKAVTSLHTQSCGCLQEQGQIMAHWVHGMTTCDSPTPEFTAWCNMKARCYNPKNHKWARYGGRGILVCKRWKHSFVNFLHDLGFKPTHKHSLGRKNNDGNYEPNNCEWQTEQQQSCNKSTNHFLEFSGRKLTINQWVIETGIARCTIKGRIKLGWPIARILNDPVRSRPRKT